MYKLTAQLIRAAVSAVRHPPSILGFTEVGCGDGAGSSKARVRETGPGGYFDSYAKPAFLPIFFFSSI